jgi:hypothetical protein
MYKDGQKNVRWQKSRAQNFMEEGGSFIQVSKEGQ